MRYGRFPACVLMAAVLKVRKCCGASDTCTPPPGHLDLLLLLNIITSLVLLSKPAVRCSVFSEVWINLIQCKL